MSKEKFRFSESLSFEDGRLIANTHASGKLVGILETTAYDSTGRVLFKRKDQNDVILPGSLFVLEQLFKQKAADRKLHPTSVNTGITDFGTVRFTSKWTEPSEVNDELIFGFMAGNGGATANGTNPVTYGATSLVNGNGETSFLPFRIVNASYAQPSGYALPVLVAGHYLYYAKRFDTTPTIVMADNTAYAQAQINITAEEFREYFAKAGVTENAGLNQIGLVAGLYNPQTGTYDDVRLITTVNFTTIDLTGDTKFSMNYKLYCL